MHPTRIKGNYKMDTITLKEDWKAPFTSSSYLNTLKQLLRFFFWGGLIIGIVFFVISFDTNAVFEGLKRGGLLLVLCMLGGPAVLIVLYIFLIPIILLFQIPKIISPNTYEFCVSEGRFLVKKNNSPIIDITLYDYLEHVFVVVRVNDMGGNALGNVLRIKYIKKGKEKTKEINLNYFNDKDKICLHQFMNSVNMYKMRGL